MESKWYFFPGQTAENTKISDRAHALHITSAAWKNVTQHLDRKKRIQEAIDKERRHKEKLKEGSQAMTKQWDDSIENIRLRKEEERKHRLDKKAEDKVQEFYKMRQEQEAVRKAYTEKIKKEIFTATGYPRELNSALILSETLHEREKQKEFNEKIRKHDEEVKKQFDREIIAADVKQKQDKQEKMVKKRQEERKAAQLLKEQIEENAETSKAKRRAHIEKETQDRINAAREEELLRQYEIEEKVKRRQEMALDKKKAREAELIRQEILAKEEIEMEKATEFYSEAKRRIDCMMKAKEKEMKEEAIKHREMLAAKAAAIQEAKDAAEDERLAKVIAERDALDKAKAEEKAAIAAQYVRERIEDRKQYLQRLEHEKHVENEMKRWELLNRRKAGEAMREYDQKNRQEKWERMMEYRKDLLEQIADDKEIKRQEKEIEEIMSHVSFEEADKMFFEYADEVMELARRKNRSTYPIEKVILEYKKVNSLLPKKDRQTCNTK